MQTWWKIYGILSYIHILSLALKILKFHFAFVLQYVFPFSLRFPVAFSAASFHHESHNMHNFFLWIWNMIVRGVWHGLLNKQWFFAEFFWRCILKKQVEKGLAVILGVLSITILLAEATLLPTVDLSLFSILIKSVGTQEVLVQVDQVSKRLSVCSKCRCWDVLYIFEILFYFAKIKFGWRFNSKILIIL